jgi:hypothetical protein
MVTTDRPQKRSPSGTAQCEEAFPELRLPEDERPTGLDAVDDLASTDEFPPLDLRLFREIGEFIEGLPVAFVDPGPIVDDCRLPAGRISEARSQHDDKKRGQRRSEMTHATPPNRNDLQQELPGL